MAAVCRRFGVSRKTGYKWLDRYAQQGVAGLADQSKAPKRQAQAFPAEIEREILALRARYPTWGEDKLKARLERTNPDINWPAHSTIGALLKRHGLTHPGKRRRHATPSSKLTSAKAPNQVWAIDFKGWFETGDGKRCDPLTISDTASRYLLRCQRVARSDTAHVRPLMEATFREYGLPTRILSDNGPPFASTGLAGLSRLSVWWIRLGIQLQRIDPGHPEQNGRHERMHRTLKAETATPPERNLRAQQRAFDRFRQIYNQERPHESLAMATPASVYQPSWRPYPERLPELEYPDRMLPLGECRARATLGCWGVSCFSARRWRARRWAWKSMSTAGRSGLGRWSWTGSSVAYSRARGRAGGSTDCGGNARGAPPPLALRARSPGAPRAFPGRVSCKEPSLGSTLKLLPMWLGKSVT